MKGTQPPRPPTSTRSGASCGRRSVARRRTTARASTKWRVRTWRHPSGSYLGRRERRAPSTRSCGGRWRSGPRTATPRRASSSTTCSWPPRTGRCRLPLPEPCCDRTPLRTPGSARSRTNRRHCRHRARPGRPLRSRTTSQPTSRSRRGLVAASIAGLAAVLVLVGIAFAATHLGQSADKGRAAGVTPSASVSPQVKRAAGVTCGNGSSAPSVSACPLPHGSRSMRAVFPSVDGACQAIDPNPIATNEIRPVFRCVYGSVRDPLLHLGRAGPPGQA